MKIPVLFTTYNRLEYTKQSLHALLDSDAGPVIIVDNNSIDGTQKFLQSMEQHPKIGIIQYMANNTGIAGAMNYFIKWTQAFTIVGKVDNDTIVPKDWCSRLYEKMYNRHIDIIQAKHPITDATYAGANFDKWMKTMERDKVDESIYYHRFVGGSGILFRRSAIDNIPETEWKLYGWNTFQKNHPNLKKAFTTDVEIELLDMLKEGGADYSKYPDYYRETRRIK